MKLKVRKYSAEICDIFEDLLEKYDITVPDEDREGDESEARLFGMNYAKIEDDITYTLMKLINEIQSGLTITVIKNEY